MTRAHRSGCRVVQSSGVRLRPAACVVAVFEWGDPMPRLMGGRVEGAPVRISPRHDVLRRRTSPGRSRTGNVACVATPNLHRHRAHCLAHGVLSSQRRPGVGVVAHPPRETRSDQRRIRDRVASWWVVAVGAGGGGADARRGRWIPRRLPGRCHRLLRSPGLCGGRRGPRPARSVVRAGDAARDRLDGARRADARSAVHLASSGRMADVSDAEPVGVSDPLRSAVHLASSGRMADVSDAEPVGVSDPEAAGAGRLDAAGGRMQPSVHHGQVTGGRR